MAQVLADRRDVDFVLFDQLEADALSQAEAYAEFNRKVIEMIITEARNLAVKEILPTQKDGDQIGARFNNGAVTTPDSFKRAWELLKEGEWIGTFFPPEWGGQGMPHLVSIAANDYFSAANLSLVMYVSLSSGVSKLIETFGTEKIKNLFLKKMVAGEWAGTMMLTEPEAGSDVGALTTSAKKNDDGTYSITGNKIFISGGEHDLSENIIHATLARIEGAPAGSAGISLFLVPKFWVNDDGTLGERNDVVCTGIEEKMGIHGNATAAMALGGKGKCRGYLLGEENKGMRAMFQMMNSARLHVAQTALSNASASYLNAVNYARERVQFRPADAVDKNAPPVAIINHPDVRRMLITMKAYVEGSRSLLYYVAKLIDQSHLAGDAEEEAGYEALIDFLTPICKGYVTDRSYDVTNLGLQVYGGYGYTSEYPQEQLVRDTRITMIYEGTNGIQAMDYLGRKTVMDKGKAMMALMGEIRKTFDQAKAVEALKPLVEKAEAVNNRLSEAAMQLGTTMMKGQIMNALVHSYTFMDVSGDAVMAWMLLWRASIASRQLAKGVKKKDEKFMQGQIKSAEFFINTILPLTNGKIDTIMDACYSAMEIDADSFGGK
ncbi:MAG: acyl-CoA dehydrogenase [Desulfatitalea sp.]|nr:acyl-CoA dehydrogenase [Desulfatitalea sp.]NNJ99217.1 acyl-CoA dehydrogenase [Desulfatitalea sp.]